MRLRPNLHDLYVGRVVLATVLLTWAVLFEKLFVFTRARRANNRFLEAFRKGELEHLSPVASNSAMARRWAGWCRWVARPLNTGRQSAARAEVDGSIQAVAPTSAVMRQHRPAKPGWPRQARATSLCTTPWACRLAPSTPAPASSTSRLQAGAVSRSIKDDWRGMTGTGAIRQKAACVSGRSRLQRRRAAGIPLEARRNVCIGNGAVTPADRMSPVTRRPHGAGACTSIRRA